MIPARAVRSADGTDRLEYLTGTLRARFESRAPVGDHTSTASLHDLHLIEPQVRDAEWSDAPPTSDEHLADETLARGLADALVRNADGHGTTECDLEKVRLSGVRLVNVQKSGAILVGDIEARVTAVRRVFVPAPVVVPDFPDALPVSVAPSPPRAISAPVQDVTPTRVPAMPRLPSADLRSDVWSRFGRGCLTSVEGIVAALMFGAVLIGVFWVLSAILSPVYDVLTRLWDRSGLGSIPPSVCPGPMQGWVRWWGGTMHPVGQLLSIGVFGYVVYALWRIVKKRG